jgi:hypothetical protein
MSSISSPVKKHRGALVYDNETTGSNVAIEFEQELYDTDNIHSNITNPDRLTVPAGVSLVRLSFNITISGTTANQARILKNGLAFVGSAFVQHADAVAQPMLYNGSTPIIPVTEGDYFNLRAVGGNAFSDNGTTTWFAMEIIE